MTPTQQPTEEQKKEFFKALEDFQQSQGSELRYQELLENNKNLEKYFIELVESALTENLEIIDLLLSKDETASKIKINNENILRCLIENFEESISSKIINEHIKKFDSIGEDKDIDGNNLIASLLIVEYAQDEERIVKVTKLIKILIESGVSVNDKNNLGDTPLDFCWNFEIFKILAQDASQETLEKKLRHIIENEDLASEAEINITKFLLTEKKVKIDGFFDWKWPEIPIYRKAIFAQIVLEYGNDEQKKCLQAYSSTDANSPFFAIIDDDIRFDSEPLNFKEEIKKDRITMAIILNKKEALKKIIRDDPEILEEEVKSDLTPVFYAIDRGKLNALEVIIRARPEVLDQKDTMSSLPVFYAINCGALNALEIIIKARPQVLDQQDKLGFTPVFYAIKYGALNALETIIKARPPVLYRQSKHGVTAVFYAINCGALNALEIIIKARPQVLDQQDKLGLTPVFYAIWFPKLDALRTIIDNKEEALEQQNLYGENPILFSLRLYSSQPSTSYKEILKFIFQKQFGRDLQDEEIKNLVEFVNNYNFLKLFYNQTGQPMHDYNFKSILSSVLPQETKLEGELSKKLFKIYETIAEAKDKPSLIINNDDEKEKTSIHIYQTELEKHFSFFIFHVNDQNKLTKISYCDGNLVFSERTIIRHGTPSGYIHGVTTFELTQPQDFIPKFAEDFIKKNSKKRKIEEFYSQEFSPEKLSSEEKEIFGIKFSKITHFIPTKMQSRGNCSLKSSNILARFLLTHQEGRELFTYDETLGIQGGEGYRPYKDLRQKMVDKAIDNLSKITEKLPKDFATKLKIYKEISSLYTRSIDKAREKIIKETTKLNPSLYLLDKINREQYLSDIGDATSIKMIPTRRLYRQIATLHFNFTDQDKALIEAISTEEEVKIDGFLDWDFETPQAKNNFVKLVFDYGDEVKKESFKNQLVASNPQQRNKFFEDLNQENISLILNAFELEKLQLKNLREVREKLQAKKIADPHRVKDSMSDPTSLDTNDLLDKMKSKSDPQILNGFVKRFFLNYRPEDREKLLNCWNNENLSFMLNHSEKILEKLENSVKIITELKIYAQRIDQKLPVEVGSEATGTGSKRFIEEESGGKRDPSSILSNKKIKVEKAESFSVAKFSSPGSL